MDDEKLVEAVRSYTSLWQVQSGGYKDLRAKENAWKEVASKVGEGCTVEGCNRRWKVLRDKFVREQKKSKTKKSGDAGPVVVSTWPLFEIMSFISDTIKHKRPPPTSDLPSFEGTASDAEEDEMESSTVDGSTAASTPARVLSPPPPPQRPRKRRRQQEVDEVDRALLSRLENLQGEQQDGEAAFGEHVAACLRQLDSRQKAIARVEIDKLLLRIQFPNDPYFTPSQTPDYYNF